MGLFVTTTGTDVSVPELGITIVHPTTDFNVTGQFSAEEIKGAASLTTAIQNGTLIWRRVAAGANQVAADYDSDFAEVEELSAGAGSSVNDTLVTPFGTPALSTLGSVQATTNSIKTLTRTSNTQQIFTGTTAGQRINLPVATTLINSHVFEIWNLSSQNLDIRNAAGTLLATIKPNGRTTAILYDNSTSNGTWAFTYTLDNGNVFGTQLFYQEDNTETSNNSTTTWANKVTLTTPSLPLGDYLVQYQFNWRASNADRQLEVRVQRGGSTLDTWEPFTGSSSDRQLLSGFKRVQTISGVQTFTLDFRVGGSGTTIFMSNARLFVWRVG